MEIEQQLGIFRLGLGLSVFFNLFLLLRALSGRVERAGDLGPRVGDDWVGLEPLVIQSVRDEARDIRSFRLAREGGRCLPSFRAGQFLSVAIGGDPKLVRSYSISSAEYERGFVEVSVKRINGGRGSEWFHSLSVGDRVWAFPPMGHFVLPDNPKEILVMVAGGVGVTPIISMIRSAMARGWEGEVFLFYGVRTEADLAFYDELALLARRHPRFRLSVLLSEGQRAGLGRGFVTPQVIEEKTGFPQTAHYYVCGPKPMMASILEEFVARGLPENQWHSEEFVSPTDIEQSVMVDRRAMIKVGERRLPYEGRQTLLDFLNRHGLEIPSSCRSGVCGTCKVQVRGEVESLSKSGLTLFEQRSGYCLACVSLPRSGEVEVIGDILRKV